MRSDALDAIRAAKLARLEQLEIQQARTGAATDPSVVNEIDDLRVQLGFLDSGSNGRLDYDTRRAIRSVDQHEFNLNVLATLVQRVTLMEQSVQLLMSESGETRWRLNMLIIVILLITVAAVSYLWGSTH